MQKYHHEHFPTIGGGTNPLAEKVALDQCGDMPRQEFVPECDNT